MEAIKNKDIEGTGLGCEGNGLPDIEGYGDSITPGSGC